MCRAQMAERLHAQCQAFLLSQLLEAAHPAALAAAGHLGDLGFDFDRPSSPPARIAAEPHDEGAAALRDPAQPMDTADNASCTIADLGALGCRGPRQQVLLENLQEGCASKWFDIVKEVLATRAHGVSCVGDLLPLQGAAGAVQQPSDTWGIPPFFVERGPHTDAQQGAAFEFR